MNIRRVIILTIVLLYVSLASAFAQSAPMLLPGSPYSTAVFIVRSAVPGPAVMVLGGVHGNEPAGALAAEQISRWAIKSGMLIVIPRMNTLALDNAVRTLPHIGDINRAYPGKADGSPAEQLAFAVDELLAKYNVSMLIDLHEGRDFHRLDKSSVGQTILFAANDKSTMLAMDSIDYINKQIAERHKHFSLVSHPIPRSGAHHAALRYGIAAFTLETAGIQPLANRITHHTELVRFLLQREGLL